MSRKYLIYEIFTIKKQVTKLLNIKVRSKFEEVNRIINN